MKINLFLIILFTLCATSPFSLTCYASAAGKEFNEADAALNSTYRTILSTISGPKQRLSFVAAQKIWLKYRDENVAFFAERYPESKGGLFYNIHLIKERTAFLKSILATSPDQDAQGIDPSGYL